MLQMAVYMTKCGRHRDYINHSLIQQYLAMFSRIWALFKCQPHKMVKYTQTICRHQPKNCLSVFDYFGRLALKGLVTDLKFVRNIRFENKLILTKRKSELSRCPTEKLHRTMLHFGEVDTERETQQHVYNKFKND